MIVQMATIDQNVHVIPDDGENHAENEHCWCQPTWDPINKIDFASGLADCKVLVHKPKKETEQ